VNTAASTQEKDTASKYTEVTSVSHSTYICQHKYSHIYLPLHTSTASTYNEPPVNIPRFPCILPPTIPLGRSTRASTNRIQAHLPIPATTSRASLLTACLHFPGIRETLLSASPPSPSTGLRLYFQPPPWHRDEIEGDYIHFRDERVSFPPYAIHIYVFTTSCRHMSASLARLRHADERACRLILHCLTPPAETRCRRRLPDDAAHRPFFFAISYIFFNMFFDVITFS